MSVHVEWMRLPRIEYVEAGRFWDGSESPETIGGPVYEDMIEDEGALALSNDEVVIITAPTLDALRQWALRLVRTVEEAIYLHEKESK